jgi:acetamidase/formamidase
MKKATRDVVYNELSRFNTPSLIVEPGETFIVATELCTGPWLKSLADTWSPEISSGPNPAVCIGVRGARPGQALRVTIEAIKTDELGYTGFAPGQTPFPDWIRRREWGVVTRTVRICNGFVEWDDLRIPVRPMIGTLGVAPAREVFATTWPGPFGGNMDVQEVEAGATVLLPVYVPDALLHVGDVHAVQGDGEINCGGGIECRGEVTLRIDLADKPERMQWPRIVNDTHLVAVGCARPAEDAFRIATEQLIYWLADEHGLDVKEAHLLLGLVMEARCTQFVDPLYTYVAKIARQYLPARAPGPL